MYSPFQLAKKYISYYFRAANSKGHGTHSPFVYQFIRDVLYDKQTLAVYQSVEAYRSKLKRNDRLLEIEEMGAGSTQTKSNTRSISSIAKHALKPKKFGQLLHRMVKYYQPQTILELGSSLGITSCYLAKGNECANFITLEGAKQVANQARVTFQQLDVKNAELIEGNFDQTLSVALDKLQKVDFGFIDGNHRFEPTLRYFKEILPYCHNDSILIFDDIHWSADMEKAWEEIISHSSIRCSIDLFFIGIVVFRQEFKEKQAFEIRF